MRACFLAGLALCLLWAIPNLLTAQRQVLHWRICDGLDLEIERVPPSCADRPDGQIYIYADGGVPPYTFSLGSGTNTDGQFTGLFAGTYALRIEDSGDCRLDTFLLLPAPSPLEVIADIQPVRCSGQQAGAIDVGVSGGRPPYTFLWDNGLTTEDANDLEAGNYELTVSDANGCSTVFRAFVPNDEPIEIQFEKEDVRCHGEAGGRIQTTVSGQFPPFDLQWSNGQEGAELNALQAGLYELTLTDDVGCTVLDSVRIEQPPALEATYYVQPPNCYETMDGHLQAEARGGVPPLSIFLNEEASASGFFPGLGRGTYSLRVRDAAGCAFYLPEVPVPAPLPLGVDLGANPQVEYGDTLHLNPEVQGGTPPYRYRWESADSAIWSCVDCPLPAFPVMRGQGIGLKVLDAQGCSAEDYLQVRVRRKTAIFVPTGFSPNGDGQNDELLVHGKAGIQVLHFRLFNRWGQLVFENRNFPVNAAGQGWNGSSSSGPLPPDVYIWQAEVCLPDGRTQTDQGSTALIR